MSREGDASTFQFEREEFRSMFSDRKAFYVLTPQESGNLVTERMIRLEQSTATTPERVTQGSFTWTADAPRPRYTTSETGRRSTSTEPTTRPVSFLHTSLATRIADFCRSIPQPSDPDIEDDLVDFLSTIAAEHGALAIGAARALLRSAATDSVLTARIILALGHIERPALATVEANQLITRALRHTSVIVREAAVSAFALGAIPEIGIVELRRAASNEPVAVLRSVMSQTADQLEQWSHQRVASEDRAKEVD